MTSTNHGLSATRRASLPLFLVLTAIVAVAVTLGACSTTEGFGTDVKNLGGGIEDSAAKNK